MTREKFSGEPLCDKCGHREFSWRYIRVINAHINVEDTVDEYIELCCERCGYMFEMEVMFGEEDRRSS